MPSSTRTIRFSDKQKHGLEELARVTRRPVNYLVTSAVERLLENHDALLAMVRQAEADSAEGRMIAHDAVMTEARAVIAAAKAKQSK